MNNYLKFDTAHVDLFTLAMFAGALQMAQMAEADFGILLPGRVNALEWGSV